MRRPVVPLTAILSASSVGLASTCADALAHASEGGHVLLLPTGHYLVGGALAVALSFLVLAVLPAAPLDAMARCRIRLSAFPAEGRSAVSLLSFLVLCSLVAAGFAGDRDPLSNPLPLSMWTLVWVGLALLQGFLGDLWSWINPWYGPWRMVMHLSRRTGYRPAPLRLPRIVGQWPAVILLFGFVWFELIDAAPDDPSRLAALMLAYWLFTFTGMLLFGYGPWTRRCEFLSLFFAILAHLAIFEAKAGGPRRRLSLCLPGAKAVGSPTRWTGGVAFILLALGSVSFDGFQRTFFWLGQIGVNPLDFPGRSALTLSGTLGLSAMVLALAALFYVCVWLGQRIAGEKAGVGEAAGLLVWSIVPISLAYHFAHYLTALLVNGQYALVALSDPFGLGWNLFGTANRHVHAGIVMGSNAAWVIWNMQAAAIVLGHLLAVLIAHIIAYRLHGTSRRAAISQLPLALLMVGYTAFGLWLLSTPSAG